MICQNKSDVGDVVTYFSIILEVKSENGSLRKFANLCLSVTASLASLEMRCIYEM